MRKYYKPILVEATGNSLLDHTEHWIVTEDENGYVKAEPYNHEHNYSENSKYCLLIEVVISVCRYDIGFLRINN